MHVTVKLRPGMDYPNPVRGVHINEVNRAPLNLLNPAIGGPVGQDVGAAMCVDGQ
jgi:hypothetical protein